MIRKEFRMSNTPLNPAVGTSEVPLESPVPFSDRRNTGITRRAAGLERRQFTNSYEELSPEAAALGQAIDQFKLQNHRRFVNYEELLTIILALGYRQPSDQV